MYEKVKDLYPDQSACVTAILTLTDEKEMQEFVYDYLEECKTRGDETVKADPIGAVRKNLGYAYFLNGLKCDENWTKVKVEFRNSLEGRVK